MRRMGQLQEELLAAIKGVVVLLPDVQYNISIMEFLCEAMEKFAFLLPQILEGCGEGKRPELDNGKGVTDSRVLGILKEEITKATALVEKHVQPFRIQTFCRGWPSGGRSATDM